MGYLHQYSAKQNAWARPLQIGGPCRQRRCLLLQQRAMSIVNACMHGTISRFCSIQVRNWWHAKGRMNGRMGQMMPSEFKAEVCWISEVAFRGPCGGQRERTAAAQCRCHHSACQGCSQAQRSPGGSESSWHASAPGPCTPK